MRYLPNMESDHPNVLLAWRTVSPLLQRAAIRMVWATGGFEHVGSIHRAGPGSWTTNSRSLGMMNKTSLKKTLAIGAIALFGTLSASAQEKNEVPALGKAWVAINTEMLNVQLKLNDAQKVQVREIDERYTKKHTAMESAMPKPTEAEMATKVEALMIARDKDMRAVLNADQYAEWEKKRQMGTSELNDEQKEKMEEKSTD